MSLIDLSLEIIQRTNDGRDLSPNDLHLTECACNGFLTPKGEKYFHELHARVMNGEYDKAKVWHFGVEHMTKDHQGYIYFKGRQCEHYSFPSADDEKAALIELQRVCLLLESKGIEVDTTTAVWHVEKYLTKDELNPQKV